MATPLISAAVAANTKNHQSAQVTNSNIKSLTGGKILSLTDMQAPRFEIESDVNCFQIYSAN